MPFEVRRYPHNDLGNLAHYHLETINRKVTASEREGLTLDCTSFLIALAFHVEALFNFLGGQKIPNWQERDPYRIKFQKVLAAIGLSAENAEVPIETLKILKAVRDDLAHGKPAEFAATASSRLELHAAMTAPWDKHLTPEFCNHAYEQVKTFKLLAFKRAGIRVGTTLTSAIGGW